jgi:hypothetical protein
MFSKVLSPSGALAGVRRAADGAFIPADPLNMDWQAVQRWCEAGNSLGDPAPAPPPSPPPEVALWQARAALAAHGLIDAANAAVAASGNPALKAAWEYGNIIRRESPAIATLGAALSLDAAAIDALFIEAAALTV